VLNNAYLGVLPSRNAIKIHQKRRKKTFKTQKNRACGAQNAEFSAVSRRAAQNAEYSPRAEIK
jgi:hypothetical protein